ncbi:SDR family NAD(P)-dependent oxidoreductase [Streptosporangium subroseum]|uniref:SDR family NAD(P)-dependent oxidoreductase n=1 Tax=Streptosporangium subroseum TaxID=106412 RepID=UPI00343B8476
MTQTLQTPFGFASTAEEVLAGVDLSGARALVTGASSGVGVETARALAGAGAGVVLGVRDVDVGKEIAARISASTGNQDVGVGHLDLADLGSVRAFAGSWQGPLHMLVNNAGIMALPELTRTPQGREMQFAVNFLGHFALTVGLHDALARAEGARVVSLSSNAHLFCPVVFDDLDHRFRFYNPIGAYGESKTAAVLLAASPLLAGVSGRYFEDCNEAPLLSEKPAMFGGGVAPFALDPGNAERLWTVATSLVS